MKLVLILTLVIQMTVIRCTILFQSQQMVSSLLPELLWAQKATYALVTEDLSLLERVQGCVIMRVHGLGPNQLVKVIMWKSLKLSR